MSKIEWDRLEERFFERGVSQGVLYDFVNGQYVDGVAWNGLTGVTQSPSGAEANKHYADNDVYVSLMSKEWFGGTIEAFMAPDKFDKYNGVARTASGAQYGQQSRGYFGFSWRIEKGTAENEDLGYVLNFAYGCQAGASEQAHTTVNETPEPLSFSWSLTTVPVKVAGFKPVALVKVDSTDPSVNPANLAALEAVIYGAPGVEPRMPLPAEIDAILAGGVDPATPIQPAYDPATDTITIPTVTGVDYTINGVVVEPGPVVITEDTIVEAQPQSGYTFTGTFVKAWLYDVS